ncbi:MULTISPECIES: HD domain-containing protein [unclassified Methanoculleus]|uniref:HD domain-containing protein n=1 Tax=unclassified Methanoculleus TaxID=2619537 RepID=UPI0025EEA7AB|nr:MULTISPECIES: HD domain-containing protein [unclassified Methanoculleus]MCK9318483.1 HDIG domain-containing protein [Methanoculleus sp.]MDD2254347.1 HDIG domain-containing protein [Methanoculleus sp.]MDD2787999.1 HDIG domain-containing protein [Methanoculleus sp.]MDD3216718.1 HDIG domain-containing protein [Methanoculleus sp.]MDD4313601.1 HDIG domain-containing protein [Methanoculleus sp.]
MREEDCIALLRRAGCSGGVVAHCRAVRDLALTYASDSAVDRDLVAAGALLHDIGRGVTHDIRHAEVGGALCRSFDLDEAIAAIVERHIGGGLTADECSLLNLVPRDCMPQTVEEKIVAHADNLVKGTRAITLEERLQHAIALPRRQRERICHLAFEVELFR